MWPEFSAALQQQSGTSAFPQFGPTTKSYGFSSDPGLGLNYSQLGNPKPNWLSQEGMFGPNGWAGTAMQGLNVLGSAWMGMNQLSHAKNQLAESKRQFNMNWDAQKNLTNNRLEDRQRARVASNPGAYQSVGDYMNQYGVK